MNEDRGGTPPLGEINTITGFPSKPRTKNFQHDPDGLKQEIRAWRSAHREELNAYSRRWYQANHQRSLQLKKDSYLRRRARAMERLGGSCACCGERDLGFLHIDHIAPRRPYRTKRILMTISEVERSGYDRTQFRVLCANCNLGLGNFKDSRQILAMAVRYLGSN